MKHPDECEVPCYKATLVASLRERLPADEVLEELAELFGLLADPDRLRIIEALSSGEELCVCDVSHVLGISLTAASDQLRVLRDAGVVAYRDDGHMAYYRLRNGFLPGLVALVRAQLAPVVS
jgi:DNA-binding transcriptional ArsR family regulator